jgi:hypothetical protein
MQAKKQAGLPTELTKEERDNIEMSLVKIEKQGAIINPVLNEKQMEKAKQISENFIKSNVYEKVTGSPKQDWSKPRSFYEGSGGGDGNKTEKSNLYEDLLAAWNISRGGDRNSALESEARFNALAEGKFEFKWAPGGIKVSKVVIDNTTGRKSLVPVEGTVANLDALQQYFYPEKSQYDIEKEQTLNRKQKVSQTVGNKNNISQADFNAKWSKLKKGQKLTGPDGKVYTKG